MYRVRVNPSLRVFNMQADDVRSALRRSHSCLFYPEQHQQPPFPRDGLTVGANGQRNQNTGVRGSFSGSSPEHNTGGRGSYSGSSAEHNTGGRASFSGNTGGRGGYSGSRYNPIGLLLAPEAIVAMGVDDRVEYLSALTGRGALLRLSRRYRRFFLTVRMMFLCMYV